jgi:acyl-coenzyme A thioesterase PaaI-like protein
MKKERWQEIDNIFLDFPRYNCFVCSPHHPEGFRLKFYYDPDERLVVSPVPPPREELAGFPSVLHGGFQAMLLDEVMFWAVLHFHRKISLTAGMEIELLQTVHTKRPMELKARVLKGLGGKLFVVESWIEVEGKIPARARGNYAVPSLEALQRLAGDHPLPEKYRSFL